MIAQLFLIHYFVMIDLLLINATLNKYNPGNVDQENADKQALAKWKEKNAKKLKVKFAENLRKMAIPDENEATGIEIVEGG